MLRYVDPRDQGSPWTLTRSAACQYGMTFPGHEPVVVQDGAKEKTYDAFGSAIQKERGWLSNFPLDLLSRKCGCPDALGATKHYHVHARGDYTDDEDGKRKKVSKFTGQYTEAEAESYAVSALLQTVTQYTRVDIPEMEKGPTELMKLAQESDWYQKYRGAPPREIGEVAVPEGSTRATR